LESNNDYHFSIFHPTNEYGRRNRNIIISMIIIWAVAVFGFQILLRVFQKLTPEKALITYESVIDNVKTGKATVKEKQDFINSLVAVLGKSTIKKEDKTVLGNALSYCVFNLTDSSNKAILLKNIEEFQIVREEITKTVSDEQFIQAKALIDKKKTEIINQIAEITGNSTGSLESNIIAFNLVKNDKIEIGEEDVIRLNNTMKLYLRHYQSFLTDSKFLGFPFHYFYTAEFLLILFVLLCLIYSIRIQMLQKKYSIVEG
jgi:uncharacterized membrane protein